MANTGRTYVTRSVTRKQNTPKRKLEEDIVEPIIEPTRQVIKRQKKSKVNKENNSENSKLWECLNSEPMIDGVLIDDKENNLFLVSPSKLSNYLLKDPILDWIELYYSKQLDITTVENYTNEIQEERSKLNTLFKFGLEFEDKIFENLKSAYKTDTIQISYGRSDLNRTKFQETIDAMKSGIPLIFQAVLYNDINKTYGIADIVIRSDWINKLFGKTQIDEFDEAISAPNINANNYHYRVIDIKWTTIQLCSNGLYLRNESRIPAYKGQLAIYNCCIGNIQGYFPNTAYIMAKSWKYESCGEKFSGWNTFDTLGHIDYGGFDKTYIRETAKAIEWVRNLRLNGSTWSCNPPTVPELYPNMCNTNDTPYHKIKKEIANNIHELTELWMVGPRHRIIGHTNGIYSWKDERCCPKLLGINGAKIGPTLEKIININNSTDRIIDPDIIENNDFDWQNESELDFYVDFESITNCLTQNTDDMNIRNSKLESTIIFMIGVVFKSGNTYDYKVFTLDKLTKDNEKKIITDFFKFINSHTKEYNTNHNKKSVPRFFHWGNAEQALINSANIRHGNCWTNNILNTYWVDFCQIFRNVPIVINGAKNFSLKEIGKAMHKHGLLRGVWDKAGPSNGLDAMMDAIKYYGNKIPNDQNNTKIKMITEYNKIDCEIVHDIVTYLRSNHTSK